MGQDVYSFFCNSFMSLFCLQGIFYVSAFVKQRNKDNTLEVLTPIISCIRSNFRGINCILSSVFRSTVLIKNILVTLRRLFIYVVIVCNVLRVNFLFEKGLD